MKRKKVLQMLLFCALSAGMTCCPVSAAAGSVTISKSLDPALKGSVTLHKLIENDGQNTAADGLKNENESRRPVADIGFSYKKIADIVNVAEEGQTGVYFKNIDQEFLTLAQQLNVKIEPVKIGNNNYYTIQAFESAIDAINGNEGDGTSFTGQTRLTEYVSGGTKMEKTDSTGTAEADDLALGLYLVGETDISAHDGLDSVGQPINESPNPEAPVIESPADPFLVSVPMTNAAKIGDAEAGTVWQYDIDVYPKDQTNSITKKIIDPDEKDDKALRDQEDYQIGDTVSQVIYSDAPKLQPGKTHKTYKISDSMTEGLSFDKIVRVSYGNRVASPDKESSFNGFTELAKTDYTLTVAEDKHSFAVELTESGLAKLDKISSNSQVAVFFDSVLNSKAKIGTDPVNENHPILTWKNSNTLEKSYQGNKVYDFTYELDVLKKGVKDASAVTFEFSEKDTGVLVRFVQDGNGVYHLFDRASDTDSHAVKEIHPSSDGHLSLKGLDTREYILTETKTEAGKNLPGEPVHIILEAADPGRDGNLTKAQMKVGEKTGELTHSKGIVHMTVENTDSITLRTGGEGTLALYAGGTVILCMAGAGYLLLCGRKKKTQ